MSSVINLDSFFLGWVDLEKLFFKMADGGDWK